MAILFDENGYLKPYEPIEMTLDDILSAATRYNTADWKYLYGHDKRSRRKGFVSIKF